MSRINFDPKPNDHSRHRREVFSRGITDKLGFGFVGFRYLDGKRGISDIGVPNENTRGILEVGGAERVIGRFLAAHRILEG
jgi:hypothetical protein